MDGQLNNQTDLPSNLKVIGCLVLKYFVLVWALGKVGTTVTVLRVIQNYYLQTAANGRGSHLPTGGNIIAVSTQTTHCQHDRAGAD